MTPPSLARQLATKLGVELPTTDTWELRDSFGSVLLRPGPKGSLFLSDMRAGQDSGNLQFRTVSTVLNALDLRNPVDGPPILNGEVITRLGRCAFTLRIHRGRPLLQLKRDTPLTHNRVLYTSFSAYATSPGGHLPQGVHALAWRAAPPAGWRQDSGTDALEVNAHDLARALLVLLCPPETLRALHAGHHRQTLEILQEKVTQAETNLTAALDTVQQREQNYHRAVSAFTSLGGAT